MSKRKLPNPTPHQLNILFPIEGGKRDAVAEHTLSQVTAKADEEAIRQRIFDNLKLTGLIRSSK